MGYSYEKKTAVMEFKKILLIEDDKEGHPLLRDILEDRFNVASAKNGDAGFMIARTESPDLILLDLIRLKTEGIETCSLLRTHSSTAKIPIIVITKSSDFEVHLRAFSAGADDLLTRPFRPRELLARIKCRIRRLEEKGKQPTSLQQGNLEMDLERLEARVASQKIFLSVLEFNLLRYFVENFGRVQSRVEILQSVWNNSEVSDRTVDTHMTSLRKKIRGSSLAFVTLYGAGYSLRDRNGLEIESGAGRS
jgi:DNA-binding response OmpR family regulator